MNTLEDFLKRDASLYPDKIAIFCQGNRLTYAQLYGLVCSRSSEFLPFKGKAVVFPNTQDADFIITYLAIHMAGAVAVPLEKDCPEDRFLHIQKEVSDTTFEDAIADILFTTGTTGKSKGVMIGHQAILADGENLIEAQGFNNDTTFIISGPMNHIGCLSKIFPVIMCGATLYILEGMKDINAFFDAISWAEGKVATFLVPASIHMLLFYGSKKLRQLAHKIDFIETGAAPITHTDMSKLCEMLPTTRLYNTYASTETGIIATYNYNDGRCTEGCLGKAMKNSRFFITEKGTIACQGQTLMSGYFGEEEMTRKVLRDNTLYSSDLGNIDDEGMLHILGREDDVINTGGFKVAPSEVESVALERPEISDCICIAAPHPIIGTVLKLLIVSDGDIDKKGIARYLQSKLESYKLPFFYEKVECIHRTFNGKIDRKFYR
jgi:acyl-CoA synthetase (AMP-forming)/AMP-acid ligase II